MSASSQMALGAVDPSPATAFKTSTNPSPTAPGDSQDSPQSFQSVMQDYHDQPDDASSNASGSSRSETKKDTKSTKRSSKDDSKESQKASDKQDPANSATATPVTAPAQNVPVVPIQFLLSNFVAQQDQPQDPAGDAGNTDAISGSETGLDANSLDTNNGQTNESQNIAGKQDQVNSANGMPLATTVQNLQAGEFVLPNFIPQVDQGAAQATDQTQDKAQGPIPGTIQNNAQNDVQEKTSRKLDADRQKLDDAGASQSAANQLSAALKPTPPAAPVVTPPAPVPASSVAQEMASKTLSQDPNLAATVPGVEGVSADAKSQPAELAFAARLSVDTPATNGPATNSPTAAQESLKQMSPGQSSEVPAQIPAQAAQKYTAAVSATQPADAREGKNQHGSQSELPAKGDSGFASIATTPTNSSAAPAKETFSTSLSQPASGPHEIEAPPTQASANNDIRVKLPDDRGGSTEVRFLNTGSEVKVSVRTGDSALAQTLRSGLNDLTTRLTSEGIHTEMWRPGSDSGFSQSGQQNAQHNGSQSGSSHQSTDSNGSGSGNAGSRQQRQNDSQQDKPKWLQELEEFSGTISKA